MSKSKNLTVIIQNTDRNTLKIRMLTYKNLKWLIKNNDILNFSRMINAFN